MSYRLNAVGYVPRRKLELIDMIVKSGQWAGTKQTLRDMERSELVKIFYAIRHSQLEKIMNKKIDNLILSNNLKFK